MPVSCKMGLITDGKELSDIEGRGRNSGLARSSPSSRRFHLHHCDGSELVPSCQRAHPFLVAKVITPTPAIATQPEAIQLSHPAVTAGSNQHLCSEWQPVSLRLHSRPFLFSRIVFAWFQLQLR